MSKPFIPLDPAAAEEIGMRKLLQKLTDQGLFKKLTTNDRYVLQETVKEWHNGGSPGTLASHLADTVLAEHYPLETLLAHAAALTTPTPTPAPVEAAGAEGPDFYTPILLNKSHSTLVLLLELINTMLPKVPKSKLDADERNDLVVIAQTVAVLVGDLKEQEKKLSDVALTPAPATPVAEGALATARMRGTLLASVALLHDAGHHQTANDLEASMPALLAAPVAPAGTQAAPAAE